MITLRYNGAKLYIIAIFVWIGILTKLRVYRLPIEPDKLFVNFKFYRRPSEPIKCIVEEVVSNSGSGDQGIPH